MRVCNTGGGGGSSIYTPDQGYNYILENLVKAICGENMKHFTGKLGKYEKKKNEEREIK
jgi:hypothetical protein